MTKPTVVAVANAAGSAGKSTTVAALAALLGGEGRRVLVIDADAQGTATQWLGLQPESASLTLADVLLHRRSLCEAVLDTAVPGVSVLPGNAGLNAAMLNLPTMPGSDQRLRAALTKAPNVDVILIDCPGTLSILTVSAMVAADHVVTVTFPTWKEIQGVPALQDALDEVRQYLNDKVTLAAIVPCNVPPTSQGRVYTDVLALLRRTYGDLVAPSVRRSSRVAEAHAAGLPIPLHSPRERVTRDYRDVHAWLRRRGVL